MSKFLFAALVAAVLFAPGALAQDTSHSVAVEIQDLDGKDLVTNQTSLVVPFKVHASVSGAPPCFSQSGASSYTIALSAEVVDSTGNSTTAHVNPTQVTIAGPVLLPALPTSSGERTEDATLVVNSGPYSGDALNATIKVTATFSGSNGGCQGVTAAPASSAEATMMANFEPVPNTYGDSVDNSEKMPGVGLGLMLVALAGLVAVIRRK